MAYPTSFLKNRTQNCMILAKFCIFGSGIDENEKRIGIFKVFYLATI